MSSRVEGTVTESISLMDLDNTEIATQGLLKHVFLAIKNSGFLGLGICLDRTILIISDGHLTIL